jgi:hypothetical protein
MVDGMADGTALGILRGIVLTAIMAGEDGDIPGMHGEDRIMVITGVANITTVRITVTGKDAITRQPLPEGAKVLDQHLPCRTTGLV